MTDTNTKSGKSGRIMKRPREADDDDNAAVTPVPQSANKSKHIKWTSNSTDSTKNSPESSEDEPRRMERQMRMKGKLMNRTLSAKKPLKCSDSNSPDCESNWKARMRKATP